MTSSVPIFNNVISGKYKDLVTKIFIEINLNKAGGGFISQVVFDELL